MPRFALHCRRGVLAGPALPSRLQQSRFWKVSPVFWRDSALQPSCSRHAAALQPSCSRHAVLHAAVGQTARVLDSGYCDVITVVELSAILVTKHSLGQRWPSTVPPRPLMYNSRQKASVPNMSPPSAVRCYAFGQQKTFTAPKIFVLSFHGLLAG